MGESIIQQQSSMRVYQMRGKIFEMITKFQFSSYPGQTQKIKKNNL